MQRLKRKDGKEIGSFFDEWDMFASPVPQFNVEGKDRVGTSIGFLCTCLVTIAIIFYATHRGLICVNKGRPTVSFIEIENHHPQDFVIDLASPKHDFQLAFGVTEADDQSKALSDKDYVEWSPMFIEMINNTETMVP